MAVLDLTKEYGIVLEGGGAKGAYQVGAWKALREAGVKIKGISGASVGALNGAFMCMDTLDAAEAVWRDISYSRVIDVEDERMERMTKRNLKEVKVLELVADVQKVLADGGFSAAPLRELIGEYVDEAVIRSSERELFVTTYSFSDRKQLTIDLKTVPDGEIGDMLLASAYLPVFKNEKLGGKRYLDGGGFNNVPLEVLLEQGYKDIIIIRIYGLGYDTEKRAVIPADVNVYHIAPRQNLGGTLEFDARRARRNMRLGYLDAKRLLYGLYGRRYYIEAPESEIYYFERMLSEPELIKGLMTVEPDASKGIIWPESGYRELTERIYPLLARELKLKAGWDYKLLYLTVLEAWARQLKIDRFRIYTVAELVKLIRQKVRKLDSVRPL